MNDPVFNKLMFLLYNIKLYHYLYTLLFLLILHYIHLNLVKNK